MSFQLPTTTPAPHTPTTHKQPLPSPSQLYRRVAGMAPKGSPVKQPCTCVMCGVALDPSTIDPVYPPLASPVNKDTFSSNFGNGLDLVRGGTVVCGDCEALWIKPVMQKYSKSYAVMNQGVFKLATNENIAAFILNPPSAPYVGFFNTRQQAHMVWRTPVQYPTDILVIRLDSDILTIDRTKVFAAVRGWQHIKKRMQALKLKSKEPAIINYELASMTTGFILPNIETAMMDDGPESEAAIKALKALGMGEWWAMCGMRDTNLDDPATWPRPVLISPLEVD